MGETVPLGEDEDEVELLIRVWQVPGVDGDDVNEGPYDVAIVSDWDGIGGREASVWDTLEDVAQGDLVTVPLTVLDGEYVYLVVTENGGSDNPKGEGEDSFVNGTDVRESDGKRDGMNDQAWTAPVWFRRPAPPPAAVLPAGAPAPFVWSVASALYHDPDCWAVELIGRAARRSGAAPRDRRKHDCRPNRTE